MQTHWFLDPIKNKYFDFTGRATRQEFWMYVLSYVILYVAISLVANVIGLSVLAILFALGVLAPSVAITARRLHDIGMSGWWQLVGLVPLLGLVIIIVLTARPGEAGSNQYGSSATATFAPAADSSEDVFMAANKETTGEEEMMS